MQWKAIEVSHGWVTAQYKSPLPFNLQHDVIRVCLMHETLRRQKEYPSNELTLEMNMGEDC